MKKIFLIFIALTIGCELPTVKISKEKINFVSDFRIYSDKGFLFTPYEYKELYQPIGMVEFSIKSGVKIVKAKFDWQEDTVKFDYGSNTEIIEYAYRNAVALGADALCNFKMSFDYKTIKYGQRLIDLPILNVSGFAIKRIK